MIARKGFLIVSPACCRQKWAVAVDFCLPRKDAGCEQERRSEIIHHEEHEGHEERNGVRCQVRQLAVQCHLAGRSKRNHQYAPQAQEQDQALRSLTPSGGGVVNGTGYYTPQVFLVPFVVKEFCASARVLVFHPSSLAAHSRRQKAKKAARSRDWLPRP